MKIYFLGTVMMMMMMINASLSVSSGAKPLFVS